MTQCIEIEDLNSSVGAPNPPPLGKLVQSMVCALPGSVRQLGDKCLRNPVHNMTRSMLGELEENLGDPAVQVEANVICISLDAALNF